MGRTFHSLRILEDALFATCYSSKARQAYVQGVGGREGREMMILAEGKGALVLFTSRCRSVDAWLPRSADMIALCIFFLTVIVSPHAAEQDRPRVIPRGMEKVCKRTPHPSLVARPSPSRRKKASSAIIFIAHYCLSLSLSLLSSLSCSVTGRRHF